MKQVFEHYGNAILTVIVLLALGGILMAALADGGYVAQAMETSVKEFVTKMNGLLP